MVRSVRTFLPVAGDPDALVSAFEGDPSRWLPGARREGPGAYALRVRAGSLSRTVLATVGATWRSGSTRWRSLTWDPAGDEGPTTVDRLLPSLDGEVGLHLGHGRATIILDARYQPPGGPVGTAVDSVALGRVAESTIRRLTASVAAGLSAEAVLTGNGSGSGHTPQQDRPAAI